MFKSKNDKLINGIWDNIENPKVEENSTEEANLIETESVQAAQTSDSEVVQQEQTTQQEVTPQEVTPQEVTPQEAAPQEAAPQEAAPQEATPQQAAPQQAAKPKKGSMLKIVLIAALVGSLFGFGGGYFAVHLYSKNVVFQTVDSNNVSQLSNQSSGYDLQTVIKQTQPSIVEIRTETVSNSFFLRELISEGAGSGVIVSSDGYIVTNNHVIEGARSIEVTTYDGTSYPATLIGTDAVSDLAIIKIEADQLTNVVLGDSENIQVGDSVVAIGNPLGQLGGSATKGIISALDREITIDNETMYLLQTDAAVNPGNSGGGLFNDRGELIGIVNAKSMGSDIEGLGFAIPVNDVKTIATQLIRDGYVSERATLGVYLSEKAASDTQTAGLYIEEVMADSGAEKAQLQAGDRFVSVNNKEVESIAQLKKILRGFNVGDSIEVVVDRGGQEVQTTVTLTEAKQ